MAKEPIYTEITNNTDEAFAFPYAEKGAIWLTAKSTTKVPYELWSAAGETNRSGLLASIVSGRISLKVYIINDKDEYVGVNFAPHRAFGFEVNAKEEEPKKEEPATKFVKPQYSEKDNIVYTNDKDDHIIRAGGKASQAAAEYIGAAPVESATVKEQSEVINGEPAKVETPIEGGEAVPGALDARNELWAKYEQAVADKKWAEAAEALTELGAEGVTARSVMTLKDKSIEGAKTKYQLL